MPSQNAVFFNLETERHFEKKIADIENELNTKLQEQSLTNKKKISSMNTTIQQVILKKFNYFFNSSIYLKLSVGLNSIFGVEYVVDPLYLK